MVTGEHQALTAAELEGHWNVYVEESDLRRTLVQIAQKYPEERALYVDFMDLDGRDSLLADHLLQSPQPTLSAGERALAELLPEDLTPASPIRLRVRNLPLSVRVPIHEIREKNLGKFLALDGIVRRITEVRPQIVEAVFECAACRDRVSVAQEDGSPTLKEPVKCDSCGKPLGKTRFTLVPEASSYTDWQKVEVQENPEKLKGGTHPEGLPVVLLEDLSGNLIPGHRVVINGELKSAPRLTGVKGAGRSSVFDLVLLANSVEKVDREFADLEISEADKAAIESLRGDPTLFQKFVDSIAPTMQGLTYEKEAIALQLFGGVPKVHPDGIKTRGDIHLLIVGDPSVGKSQLLRHIAENIAPRGIYTSGKGSTAAGLTAAVVKDDFAGGRWTLEAGAMVLADLGILMVDELDKMNDNDRSALHEALEAGVVSISKAGIVAKLMARCPVLAAANPKTGRFRTQDDKTPVEQIELTPALLSRFDVIFALQDKPDKDRDRELAGAILVKHQEGEARESARVHSTEVPSGLDAKLFSPDFMRKYIAYAKKNILPVMDDAARQTILDFFVTLRMQASEGESKAVPITLRQVEGMVRLAEASARARLSPVVTTDDANRAVKIMDHYLRTVLTSKEGGKPDIDFITVGISQSYRDQIGVVREIMRDLQNARPEGFSLEEVLEEAHARKKMDKNRARRIVEELERLNEVYKPKPGLYRLME